MAKVWEYESNEKDPLAEKVEKDKTIVMTNPLMAKHLIDRIKFQSGDRVLEPCKGDGAFYDQLPQDTINDWCEINEGRDFLSYDTCLANYSGRSINTLWKLPRGRFTG